MDKLLAMQIFRAGVFVHKIACLVHLRLIPHPCLTTAGKQEIVAHMAQHAVEVTALHLERAGTLQQLCRRAPHRVFVLEATRHLRVGGLRIDGRLQNLRICPQHGKLALAAVLARLLAIQAHELVAGHPPVAKMPFSAFDFLGPEVLFLLLGAAFFGVFFAQMRSPFCGAARCFHASFRLMFWIVLPSGFGGGAIGASRAAMAR